VIHPTVLIAVAVGQVASDPSELVRRLGSADVAEQRRAAAALIESGRTAMPALMAARGVGDTGLQTRVQEICTRIEAASVSRATRVRLELRDVPIDRAIAALGEAAGAKLKLPEPDPGDDETRRQRRITLVTPGEVPFWEAAEMMRHAAGVAPVSMGSARQLDFEKPGSESGPVSVSGPFRGQLLGVQHHRRLELGKATRGIERSTRAVPSRGGEGNPRVGPTRETLVVRLWIYPEPGARFLSLPPEMNPPLPPGPGLNYRPGWTSFVSRAEDEQGRSLRPAGPKPAGTLGGAVGFTAFVVEVPLAMPDPPSRRLDRLEISVPFSFLGERKDPIDVRLAGEPGRQVRGSGATLTILGAKPADPSTFEVIVTPDPPLGRDPESIRSRPGQPRFLDEKGKLLRPTVSESNAFLGGKRWTCRFPAGESPATLRYAGIVQADVVAVFRFSGVPLP
jgi:hypothetical protein